MALGYIRTSPYRHTMNTLRACSLIASLLGHLSSTVLKTISLLLSRHIYAYGLNSETTNEKTCTIGISQTDFIHLNTILLSCIHCHANKQDSCSFMADENYWVCLSNFLSHISLLTGTPEWLPNSVFMNSATKH